MELLLRARILLGGRILPCPKPVMCYVMMMVVGSEL